MSEPSPPLATDRVTLGPWIADRDDSREEYVIGVREGVPIGIREIATVQFGFDEPADTEQHANARLIAAAPEMLEALRSAEEGLRSCYQVCDYPANGRSSQDHALREVRDAIAKATGEPHV